MSYEDLTYTVTLSYRERIAAAVAVKEALVRAKHYAQQGDTGNAEFWNEQAEWLEGAYDLLQAVKPNN